MVERVEELSAQHEAIVLFELNRSLNGEIGVDGAGRNKGIAAKTAVPAQHYGVTEVVLGGSKVAGTGIESKRRKEIHIVDAIKAKTVSRIASTIRILASGTEVNGNAQTPQGRPIIAPESVAVDVKAGADVFGRSACKRERTRGLPTAGDGIEDRLERVAAVMNERQLIEIRNGQAMTPIEGRESAIRSLVREVL